MTHDEAHRIAATLAALPPGAGALVYDAQSGDATVALARAAGARAIVAPWCGFVAARRAALAAVTTPWTFMLDADEALDPALAAALGAVEPPPEVDGFTVRRTTYFCGRAMRHGAWGADAPLRLFRTTRATLGAVPAAGGEAELHERWSVPGRIDMLSGILHHFSYPTLAAYRQKFARYTALEAAGLTTNGAKVLRAFLIATLRTPWLLFARGGWRDGWRGTYVALASAAYPLAVACKAWRWRR